MEFTQAPHGGKVKPFLTPYDASLLFLSFSLVIVDPAVWRRWPIMDEHVINQTEHMTTIEASAVSQQVQQVHFRSMITKQWKPGRMKRQSSSVAQVPLFYPLVRLLD